MNFADCKEITLYFDILKVKDRRMDMYTRKRKYGVILLILCLGASVLTGCSGEKDKDSAYNEGWMNFGYFFEEDGIYLTTEENRMMSSSWEDVNFEYICEDLTCDHKGEDCSARLIENGDGTDSVEFYVKYQDKLIIFDSYAVVDGEMNDTLWKTTQSYKTTVYEANSDGSNRVKKMEFDGSIAATSVSYAVALADDKLFFGGPMRDYVERPINEDGTLGDPYTEYDGAVYEIDLQNYTCKTYGDFYNDHDESWNYRMRIFDGGVYACVDNTQENKATWYQINQDTDESRMIKEFSSGFPWLDGVIDNQIYYHDIEEDLTLYTSLMDDTEDESVFFTFDGTSLSVFILDDNIIVRTAASFDEGNDFSEFTWYNTEGKELKTVKYDKYITDVTVVGDRLVYMTPFEEKEEWWCDKADFENLEEKSTYIGSIWGREHDEL
jgi:hypothetical protein